MVYAIPLSTFPYIPQKATFREKSFITKSLEQDAKTLDFHFTSPADPDSSGQERYALNIKF